MINATDRNTINTDNYQIYFNKLFTSKGIKIQDDVLNKETIKAYGLKAVSSISGIVGTCFMIYNYMSPETTVKTAALVAAGSNILNRTNTLFNYGYGYGTPSISDNKIESCLTGRETSYEVDQRSCFTAGTSSVLGNQGRRPFYHEYLNKKICTLKKG